jgi:EmrB/QacA subfamily drug resistance transporter
MDSIGRKTHPGWALALTTVAFFMSALDNLVVITALPSIHKEIGGSLTTLEWTVNAYTLALAATIITAAAVGDRVGRRLVYTAGLVLFTSASAACALAPSPEILIAARAVQGIGAGIITPLSLTILTSAFPAQRRGAIIGVWGGIGGLAIASGPLVSGAVTQGLNWHWIFWVNVPIGIVAAALSSVRLAESYGPKTRLDVLGLALVSSAAVALIWGLVRANDAGWGSGEVIGTLGLGVLLLVTFVWWEARAPEPMLPLHLFKIPTFAAANATAFLMIGTITSAAFLASQYFQLGLGFSPLGTGLRFLPWTGTPFIVAPIAGLLSDRIGTRPLIVVGLAMQAAGLAWIVRIATAGVGYDQLVLPFVVAGVGVSMALPATPTAALSAVKPAEMGKASGVLNTLQRFGAAFAVAIVSAVFAANGHFGSPASVTSGFRPALLVAAGMSLLGALTALAIASPRRAPMQMNQVPIELPAA